MKRRYPLEALQKVRRQTVDERAREVAEQARRAEQAEQAAKRVAAARRVEAERAQRVIDGERERLAEGAARVSDLAAANWWTVGAALRQAAIGQAEQAAKERLAEAQKQETRARTALADADADAKAVDKHRDHWDAERVAAEERAQEEAATEAWSGRHTGRGRR